LRQELRHFERLKTMQAVALCDKNAEKNTAKYLAVLKLICIFNTAQYSFIKKEKTK